MSGSKASAYATAWGPKSCKTSVLNSIRVRSTDSQGLSFERALTIRVTNVAEPQTDIRLSQATVTENLVRLIGTFSAVDPDSGDTFTYAFAVGAGDADNAAFEN